MKRIMVLLCVALLLGAVVGCATRGRRVDPNKEAVTSHDFNPKDLQIIAESADKLIARGVLPQDTRPAVYMRRVLNRTDDHINTTAIGEFIAVKLDESDRIQLVERSDSKEEAVKELEWQQGAFVDPATTKQVGKMVGADYFLQGVLTNISVRAGRSKGQYFLFTLTLVEVETLKSWKTAKQIQKLSKKGIFGW